MFPIEQDNLRAGLKHKNMPSFGERHDVDRE